MKINKISLIIALVVWCTSITNAGSGDPNTTASTIKGLDETSGYYYLASFGGASSSEQWMNVEDRDESYKSWAAVRFDLNTLKGAFDTAYGAGNWKVTRVELVLWESTVSWMRAGEVEIRWTNDDAVAITKSAGSPLVMYDVPDDPIKNQFATDENDTTGEGVFVKMIPYSAPALYTEVAHVLYDANSVNSQGALLIAKDIRLDDQLTLALVDDGNVKAGYAGYTNSYANEHPMLRVTAIPSGHVAVCENPPVADFTGDCQVKLDDLAIFVSQWLACGYADSTDCL